MKTTTLGGTAITARGAQTVASDDEDALATVAELDQQDLDA